ncbi:rna exonuclease [Vairimorpha apis BRL 01]|uniref:Rna exonuclease n=1 Tax=Vairimorpha apis BRL 01 TaxID=1037528 RepID=T0KY51_9MICR|nr:rna exonuclease [Vairimorpha apis BRL 01]
MYNKNKNFDLKRFKLNDFYRTLKWIFKNTRRPSFLPFKNYNKPLSVNFIFIKDFVKCYLKLPTNYKLKLNENFNFNDLHFNLTREINIRELDPSYDVISPENVNFVSSIQMEQLYDNKIFINSDINLKCPNKNSTFNNNSNYFLVSLDIEMVTTVNGKNIGRITILDHLGNNIYDQYVKPLDLVVNYETEFSGLTKENVSNGITIDQMKSDISCIIGKNTYILGHGLENDLTVLRMYHSKLIDTSYLFLSTSSRRVSLKQLSNVYLKTRIHDGCHCSEEDAKMCLLLLSIKIQEMLIAKNEMSPKIDINGKIITIKSLNEALKNRNSDLILWYSTVEDTKEYIDKYKNHRTLTFFFYEEENKIKFEF